jgi:hypothetical protein
MRAFRATGGGAGARAAGNKGSGRPLDEGYFYLLRALNFLSQICERAPIQVAAAKSFPAHNRILCLTTEPAANR